MIKGTTNYFVVLSEESATHDSSPKMAWACHVRFRIRAERTVAQPQQPAKAARIGYLEDGTAAGSAELLDAFRKQMTQLNWIEGKNLTIEYRYGEGKGVTRLAELAVELVGLKLDLIVVADASAALAAKRATSTAPIVMASVGDPVAQGLISSLARPEGISPGLQASPTS